MTATNHLALTEAPFLGGFCVHVRPSPPSRLARSFTKLIKDLSERMWHAGLRADHQHRQHDQRAAGDERAGRLRRDLPAGHGVAPGARPADRPVQADRLRGAHQPRTRRAAAAGRLTRRTPPGRSAVLYEVRPEAGWVFAVDVGRSYVRVGLPTWSARSSRARTSRRAAPAPADLARAAHPPRRGAGRHRRHHARRHHPRRLRHPRHPRQGDRRPAPRAEPARLGPAAAASNGSRASPARPTWWRTTSTWRRSARRPTGSAGASGTSSTSPSAPAPAWAS